MMFDEIHWCWSECCDLGPHACICGNDCEPDEENDMSNEPKYPDIEVPLSFEDGNAVAMVTRVVLAMRDEGVPATSPTPSVTRRCRVTTTMSSTPSRSG